MNLLKFSTILNYFQPVSVEFTTKASNTEQFSLLPGLHQVKLDIGSHVYALVDHSGLIQREAREKLRATGAAGYGTAKAKPAPQGRFQKRQREDGSHLALGHGPP